MKNIIEIINSADELERKVRLLQQKSNDTTDPKIMASYFESLFKLPYEVVSDLDIDEFINLYSNKVYKNEKVIKNLLLKKLNSFSKNAIYFFEFPIKNSRLDFGYISSKSEAFEIKTQYDNLSRLDKQLKDYCLVFEYVNVVCEECFVKKILNKIPDNIGIYSFDRNSTKPTLTIIRKPKLNQKLNPIVQISLFWEKEKKFIFKTNDNSKIYRDYSEEEINNAFKKCLKRRFAKTN